MHNIIVPSTILGIGNTKMNWELVIVPKWWNTIKGLQSPLETVAMSVWQLSSFCLFFKLLVLLKNICSVPCKMSFNLGLKDVFIWFNWGYGFWRRILQRGWCLLIAPYINLPILVMVNLDHVVKVRLSDFSTVKLLFFSFLYSILWKLVIPANTHREEK